MTLALRDVTVVAGQRTLLDRVSLELAPTDYVVLVGQNGAGKSTLLRTALGLVPTSTGSVLLQRDPVHRLSGRERAGRVSWLPQRSSFHEPMQVLDFVCAARFRFDESRARAEAASRQALDRVGAAGFADRDLSTLSGGEQQRVALASMLAQEAPLLLLDEPAAHLDPRQQLEIHALLARLWRDGNGLLCATHDVNLVTAALTEDEAARVRVIGLRRGVIAFSCACDSPELGAHLGALFDVDMRIMQAGDRSWFVARAPGAA